MVVHGEDGLDEITLGGTTRVSELARPAIHTYTLDPARLGFPRRSADEIRGGDPQTNARLALRVLDGAPGAHRDIVVLNAGAAIYVAGRASDLAEGVAAAAAAIDSGRARARLDALRGLRRDDDA
jgi:anthranilate phosphoribosyltransferase